MDPDSERVVRERLLPLFREAARLNAALTIDMEQYAFKDLTLEIFRSLLEGSEFSRAPHAAIALQAYLRDAERDMGELIQWARTKRRRIGVRLVKGAYWDSEIAWAKQKGWPIQVFLDKGETDANYEKLTKLLLENHDIVDAAFGSHNLRSLAYAIVTAEQLGVPKHGYEVQMLYGMGEPVRQAMIQNGQRVRVYLPVGQLLPGMAYLIRRLMENTSNTSFLRQTYADAADVNKLIAAPAPKKPAQKLPPSAREGFQAEVAGPFHNEPLLDFSQRENCAEFAQTLNEIRRKFGDTYPLWIAGKEVETRNKLVSVNPSAPQEIVGQVSVAGEKEAERALFAAAKF